MIMSPIIAKSWSGYPSAFAGLYTYFLLYIIFLSFYPKVLQIAIHFLVRHIAQVSEIVREPKTENEALWLHRKSGGAVPTRLFIKVGGTEVEVGRYIIFDV